MLRYKRGRYVSEIKRTLLFDDFSDNTGLGFVMQMFLFKFFKAIIYYILCL